MLVLRSDLLFRLISLSINLTGELRAHFLVKLPILIINLTVFLFKRLLIAQFRPQGTAALKLKSILPCKLLLTFLLFGHFIAFIFQECTIIAWIFIIHRYLFIINICCSFTCLLDDVWNLFNMLTNKPIEISVLHFCCIFSESVLFLEFQAIQYARVQNSGLSPLVTYLYAVWWALTASWGVMWHCILLLHKDVIIVRFGLC